MSGLDESRAGNIAFRWDGEFADRALEHEFVAATWGETIARNRAILLAALIFTGAAAIDYVALGFSQIFLQLFVLRVLTLIVAFAPVVFFAEGHDKKGYYASVTFTQLYLFGVLLLSAIAGANEMRDLAVSAIVILFAYYIAVPNRLRLNALVGIACSGLLLLVMVKVMGSSEYGFGLMAIMCAVTNAVGIRLGCMAGRLRRTEYMSMQHHKDMAVRLADEVAERQIAETEARANERSFEGVFRAAPLPLALVHPGETRFIQANKAACEMLGITRDKVKDVDLETLVANGLSLQSVDHLTKLMNARKPVEVSIGTQDGRKLWVNFTTSAMRYRGGPAILIALHDVTQGRMEKENLRQARDFADAANRSKTEFLANMSHELRTPLNAIIGFSEALTREIYGPLGTPKYAEYAEDIHHSGVHLLNIINDILDLSKIEAGKFDLGEDEVELGFLIEGVMRIVSPRAQQAGIKLEMILEDEQVAARCDERAIKQVLINLLSNAVKFSREKTTVKTIVKQHPEFLRISVIDQGIGMDKEDIPRALEPFSQVDGTLTRTYEGTGLGLPLARRLTELHGGSLSIESARGQGTSVHVDLPIERLLVPVAGQADAPGQKTAGELASAS
ncbi:MAG: PAS domain-containing sensor histidine kinase [Parvibaculum sp.]